MSDTDVETGGKLTDRLRGKYRIGPATEDGEPEFGHRQFNHFTPPIQFEAADAIQALTEEKERLQRRVGELEEANANITLIAATNRDQRTALHAENERLRVMTDRCAHALTWIVDLITTDGITGNEVARTAEEVLMVLFGQDDAAISREPNDWDKSYSALQAALSPQPEVKDNG